MREPPSRCRHTLPSHPATPHPSPGPLPAFAASKLASLPLRIRTFSSIPPLTPRPPPLLDAQAFEPQQRAQAQAVVVTAVTFAISVAAPCFSTVFDPSATGARAATPFMLAAFACVIGFGVAVREVAPFAHSDLLDAFEGSAGAVAHGCGSG